MFDLTEGQIAAFHRDGYLTFDAITTQEEVARMRLIYDQLFAARAGRAVGDQFDLAGADEEGQQATLPQILNPSKYAPELADGRYRANAEIVAKRLLGSEAEFLGEHAIFKPARIGAETPWHQDEAYWDGDKEYEALSIWIPLQEATSENGCMQFVPGSHMLEVQPHHNIDHDPRVTGLVVDQETPEGAVVCPIPAGGATVHHCRTLHYAGPNRSDVPRRAYILIFGVPPRQREATRDFYWRKNDEQQAREIRRKASESG